MYSHPWHPHATLHFLSLAPRLSSSLSVSLSPCFSLTPYAYGRQAPHRTHRPRPPLCECYCVPLNIHDDHTLHCIHRYMVRAFISSVFYIPILPSDITSFPRCTPSRTLSSWYSLLPATPLLHGRMLFYYHEQSAKAGAGI